MNWWLMAVAFVLGLVITGAFMIRRVTREVPVYESGEAAPARLASGTPRAQIPTAQTPKAKAPKAKAPKADVPDMDAPTTVVHEVDVPVQDVDERTTAIPRLATGATAASASAEAASKFSEPEADAPTAVMPRGAVAKAGAAKFVAGKEGPIGPHGPGSARPAADGSGPEGWAVKGNEDSMLYHTTESPYYERTVAEVWFQDEDTAQTAGFTHWREGRKAAKFAATEPEIPPGPHGPGSAKPAADGTGPTGWTVKGNEDSMLYHSTESPSYGVTRAEIWFRDVATAEAAGFNRWDSGKSQRGMR